jgi:OOP family OmpA-OmpF porin
MATRCGRRRPFPSRGKADDGFINHNINSRRRLMKRIVIGIVMVLMAAIVPAGHAEMKAGAYSLTPFIGGYTFEGNEDLKTSPVYGLRGGYQFTKNWGVEGFFSYIPTEIKSLAGNPDVKVYGYGIEGLYHFLPESRLVPFLAVGVGGMSYDRSGGLGDRNKLMVDYGAGLKFSLTDNVALRADVRHVLPFNDRYNDLLYTVGLNFSWGGEKKPAMVATRAAEPMPVTEAKPEPKAEEPVVILASEPKVEEKVVAAVSETKAEEKVIILAFEDVHFDFDKSTLKPEAKTILKRNIQILKDNPKAKVRIAGYTSASGTEEYNQKLSERRANAVQEYLINEGVITRDRLSTIGYGESNPAMYEAAPKELYSAAAKANMRVLFEIIVQ